MANLKLECAGGCGSNLFIDSVDVLSAQATIGQIGARIIIENDLVYYCCAGCVEDRFVRHLVN